MVRIGLIGLGFMGQTHLSCYEKLTGVRVIAIADENPKRCAGDLSGGWGNLGDGSPPLLDVSGMFTTTDWRELLARPEVDAVDICVPTPFHRQIIEAAVSAGKHVLCEKPLAHTAEDAQAIASLASRSKTIIMPAMCMRFWPQWAWLKQVIDDGRYGKVRSAAFLRQGSVPPGWYRDGKMSGGAILDLHIHDTDFICHLFGKPNSVTSNGYTGPTGEIDHVNTRYHYDHIPMVIADGGWAFAEPYPFRMRYTAQFDSGTTADFDLARPDPLIVYRNGTAEPIPCEPVDGWFAEIRYFVECVRDNRQPTRVTAAEAALAIDVVMHEKESVLRKQ